MSALRLLKQLLEAHVIAHEAIDELIDSGVRERRVGVFVRRGIEPVEAAQVRPRLEREVPPEDVRVRIGDGEVAEGAVGD